MVNINTRKLSANPKARDKVKAHQDKVDIARLIRVHELHVDFASEEETCSERSSESVEEGVEGLM